MPTVGVPNLDQLQVFIAVVDEGGFAAAARKLNRAVSAISYAISNLEAQLGLVLGDILDKSLRRGLMLSNGSLEPFILRPISAVLAAATLATRANEVERRASIFLMIAMRFLVASAVLTILTTPKFTARASIEISSQAQQVLGGRLVSVPMGISSTFTNTLT